MEEEKRYLVDKIEVLELDVLKLKQELKRNEGNKYTYFIKLKLDPKEEELNILNNILRKVN